MLDVLRTLLAAHDGGERLHGWVIAKSARRAGPTVYGVLDRLEDAGWIEGEFEVLDEVDSRPRRRYYKLTEKGVTNARALMAIAEELS